MKHRRTREIVIELTSLLDVVMILIFAVLLQNSELIEQKNEEITAMASEKESLMEEIGGLNENLAELIGEIDILSGENEKLSAELLKAIADLSESDIEALLESLKTAEKKEEIMEAVSEYVYIYYITETTFKSGTGNEDFEYNLITYGALFGAEKEITIPLTEASIKDESTINGYMKIIENDINTYIENNLSGYTEEKNFYVVISMDEHRFTAVDDGLRSLQNNLYKNKSITKILYSVQRLEE